MAARCDRVGETSLCSLDLCHERGRFHIFMHILLVKVAPLRGKYGNYEVSHQDKNKPSRKRATKIAALIWRHLRTKTEKADEGARVEGELVTRLLSSI